MCLRTLQEIFRIDVFLTLCHVVWLVLKSTFPFLSRKTKLDVRGKCILVTGGSRGVGEELLSQFAKFEPCKVRRMWCFHSYLTLFLASHFWFQLINAYPEIYLLMKNKFTFS